VEECSQQVHDKEVCSMSDFDSQTPPSTTTDIRRVRRSRQDRVIGGVCGGLAQYVRVDPVLLRIAAVALALSGGVGLLAYVIAWIIIPEATGPEPAPSERVENRHGLAVVVGAALVALGGLLLLNQFIPWFSAAIFWPIVVVVVGVLVLTSARR
jgi:phage shock protein C